MGSNNNSTSYCISLQDVEKASQRIQDIAHRTPVLTSQSLIPSFPNSHDDGKKYFFKVEAMQKTGSFKFRGALNAIKTELESFDGDSIGFSVNAGLGIQWMEGGPSGSLGLSYSSSDNGTDTFGINGKITFPLQ